MRSISRLVCFLDLLQIKNEEQFITLVKVHYNLLYESGRADVQG